MNSINIFLFGSTLCQLRKQLRPKTGKYFLTFSFFYWFYIFLFMKCINISCLGARCVSSWSRYGLKQVIHWHFFPCCLYISWNNKYLYKISSYTKKYIIKIITLWHTVVGIYGSRGCGFVVCVVGVWGCRQTLNRLKINILFWRKIIWTMRTTRSGLGQ